jgi:hypothetical protein
MSRENNAFRHMPWRSAEGVITRTDLSEDEERNFHRIANKAIREAMESASIAQDIKRRANSMGLDLAASADKQSYCIVPLQRPESEL